MSKPRPTRKRSATTTPKSSKPAPKPEPPARAANPPAPKAPAPPATPATTAKPPAPAPITDAKPWRCGPYTGTENASFCGLAWTLIFDANELVRRTEPLSDARLENLNELFRLRDAMRPARERLTTPDSPRAQRVADVIRELLAAIPAMQRHGDRAWIAKWQSAVDAIDDALGIPSKTPNDAGKTGDEPGDSTQNYAPPSYFSTTYGIPSERLRRARMDNRLPARSIGTPVRPRWHYSIEGARRLWPDDMHVGND